MNTKTLKKSIMSVAIAAAASSANAMPEFNFGGPEPVKKISCLEVVENTFLAGATVDTCDSYENNLILKRPLKKNGCAKGQVAIVTYDSAPIGACMPAGAVQL